jgi:hypothetical protein
VVLDLVLEALGALDLLVFFMVVVLFCL